MTGSHMDDLSPKHGYGVACRHTNVRDLVVTTESINLSLTVPREHKLALFVGLSQLVVLFSYNKPVIILATNHTYTGRQRGFSPGWRGV
jgi:hypothetical protein